MNHCPPKVLKDFSFLFNFLMPSGHQKRNLLRLCEWHFLIGALCFRGYGMSAIKTGITIHKTWEFCIVVPSMHFTEFVILLLVPKYSRFVNLLLPSMLLSYVQANGPMVLEPCAHSQSTGRSQPYLSHMSHEKYCSPISLSKNQIARLWLLPAQLHLPLYHINFQEHFKMSAKIY